MKKKNNFNRQMKVHNATIFRHNLQLAQYSYQNYKIKDVTPKFRKRWGFLAYPIIGIKHLTAYTWHKIHVKYELTSGYYMIIANSAFACSEYQVANAANITDGLLDLVIINRKDWWNIITLLFTISTGILNKFLHIEY